MLKQLAERFLPESLADDLEPYFQEATRTLSAYISKSEIGTWPAKIRTVNANQPLLRPANYPNVQKEVHAALLKDRQIRIAYQAQGKTEPKEYVINLLGLVEHGAAHYLVVTFETHNEPRIIPLHRTHTASALPSKSKRPDNFDLDTYIAAGAFGFSADAPEIEVTLRFYKGAGFHLKETPLSNDQKTQDIDADTLEVIASVRDNRRLHWWLRGFGADVEVVEPKTLRVAIAEALATGAGRYRDG